MVGRLDDSIGVLRVNDKGAETAGDNKTYLDKLYGFLNPSSTTTEVYCGGACKASKITEQCTGEEKNCYHLCGVDGIAFFDENGNEFMVKNGCTGLIVESCQSSYFSDYDVPLANGGTRDISYSNCNAQGEECEITFNVSDKNIPLANGGTRNITYSDCNGKGEECGSSYVVDSNIPLDNGGTRNITYSGCNGKGEECGSSYIADNNIPLKDGVTRSILYSGCNGNAVCERMKISHSSNLTLNNGYVVKDTDTIGFNGCNGTLETCTSFGGNLYDSDGNYIHYCGSEKCNDKSWNSITCPLTIDELKALFQ